MKFDEAMFCKGLRKENCTQCDDGKNSNERTYGLKKTSVKAYKKEEEYYE